MSAYLELLAHSSVAPVGKFFHLLHKLLIHHHFGGIAWGTAFQKLDAKEVVEAVGTFHLVGNVEKFFAKLTRQIYIVAIRPLECQVVAGSHSLHFGKILQCACSPYLCLPVAIEQTDIVDVIVVVSRIRVCHHFVLSAYDEHHHHQEHVDEHL